MIFAVAGSVYLIALALIHMLAPRLEQTPVKHLIFSAKHLLQPETPSVKETWSPIRLWRWPAQNLGIGQMAAHRSIQAPDRPHREYEFYMIEEVGF